MSKCPICQKEEASEHPVFGILPGKKCKQRRSTNQLPDLLPEMVGESIHEQRKTHAKSIIQPYRSGKLSKEYLDLYGTKNIKVTKEEVAKAENVWSDVYSPNVDLKKTK